MLASLLGGSRVAAQTVYNPVTQFSVAANPGSGTWTYGYKTSSVTGAFLAFDTAGTLVSSGNTVNTWYASSVATEPGVGVNLSSTNTFTMGGHTTIQPSEMNLHPGAAGQLAVLRFTAPTTGSYALAGNFSGNSNAGTTTDVHILQNNVSFFDSTVTGFGTTVTFSQTLSLTSGDYVDFVVGWSNGSYNNDSTGLVTTLTAAVPEPANVAMLAGFGALACSAWIRRRMTWRRRAACLNLAP